MRQHNPITTFLTRGVSLVLLATMLPLAATAQKQAPRPYPLGAGKQFKETRTWPYKTFNQNAYKAAMQHSSQMAPAFGAQTLSGTGIAAAVRIPNPSPPKTPVWSYIGPN